MALLEALMAGIVLAVAAVGVSLLLSDAQIAVVGQGDRYVALYLAQQKIEKLTDLANQNPPDGFLNRVPIGDSTATGGCAAGDEPCYNEPDVRAGEQVGASAQKFTRTTCVNFVNDNDPSTPTGCCTDGAGCPTTNTKRITVTVTPALPQADPVTMVTVITGHLANTSN